MAVLRFLDCLALQNTKSNCIAVINNGDKVLNLNSVVPIKTRFAHSKWHSALQECLVLMPVSKTTSLFNQQMAPN